jgi:glycosyltransferase involved in cell wall biosynthesis
MTREDNNQMHHFPDVALLITHYNRSQSLERLLQSFAGQGWVFKEIIVSDDGSNNEHQMRLQRLKEVYGFKLVTSPVNKGLGNNLNKGQDAVTAPYTLYVQEDFAPVPDFSTHFANALAIMNERPDFDMARFYSFFKYPYLQPYKHGFSEMKFGFWKAGYRKYFCYSDHPHLRRSDFFKKFGRYWDKVNMGRTEYAMMMSFLKHKGKAIIADNYHGLFLHGNSASEPSTRAVMFAVSKVKTPWAKKVRNILRTIKYSKDYLFFK